MPKSLTSIAFVRRSYRPDGGAERIIARLLEGLVTHAQAEQLLIHMIAQKWQSANDSAVNFIRLKKRGLTRTQQFKAFSHDVRTLLDQQQFDIVQSHERIPGCQIYRAGDGVHKQWLELRKRFLASKLQALSWDFSAYHRTLLQAERELFAHPRLAHVICNSQQIKTDILRHYPATDPDKLVVIYNGIDVARYQPVDKTAKQRARARLKLAPDKPLALFVGSGFERKGLGLLLEALASASDWVLLVVGGDKRSPYYQALAERLGVADRVRFCGVCADVRPFYAAVDLLVHPAYYDPAPNVVLEALACGLGVVLSDACGNAELIRENQEGMVVPVGSREKLADALSVLSADREQLASLGVRGRQLALQFPLQRMVTEMIGLYQNVLDT